MILKENCWKFYRINTVISALNVDFANLTIEELESI